MAESSLFLPIPQKRFMVSTSPNSTKTNIVSHHHVPSFGGFDGLKIRDNTDRAAYYKRKKAKTNIPSLETDAMALREKKCDGRIVTLDPALNTTTMIPQTIVVVLRSSSPSGCYSSIDSFCAPPESTVQVLQNVFDAMQEEERNDAAVFMAAPVAQDRVNISSVLSSDDSSEISDLGMEDCWRGRTSRKQQAE